MSYSRWTSSRFYTYWEVFSNCLIIDDNKWPAITPGVTRLTYEEAKELRGYLDAFIADWEIERDG